MAAVADGHTECQSEHTSDMSVQSFTEMPPECSVTQEPVDSAERSSQRSLENIGKIPLDEMMDHFMPTE